MRSHIIDIFSAIMPHDELERDHISQSLDWLRSGAEIFRIAKPNIPDIHLVSYCVLIDPNKEKILLVDHRKCDLWLPPGGHVESGEAPHQTAQREIFEELSINPEFAFANPVFTTMNRTGSIEDIHTDVSLWYVFKGSTEMKLEFDKSEFKRIQWFHFNEIPLGQCEIHLKRFLDKLKLFL